MNHVQVGDGLPTEEEKREQELLLAARKAGNIGFQQHVPLTPEQRAAAIEAAMNNKAIDNILVGKMGPVPLLPSVDPESPLGKMLERARAEND